MLVGTAWMCAFFSCSKCTKKLLAMVSNSPGDDYVRLMTDYLLHCLLPLQFFQYSISCLESLSLALEPSSLSISMMTVSNEMSPEMNLQSSCVTSQRFFCNVS